MDPATGGELAQGLLEVRVGLVDLHNMIAAMRSGEEVAFALAQKSYLEADDKLRKLISEIGGFADD